MAVYICKVCGYIYNEEVEDRDFDELPDDYECPLCYASKEEFEEE